MSIRIREATKLDTDALASLASRTFIDTYDDLTEEAFARYAAEFFTRDRIQEYLEASGICILVAEYDGLIGYILLEQSKAPVPMPFSNQIECVRLYIDKAAQGQHIGSKLLEAALRISEQNGFDTLWLKVWDQNKKAISFYENKGFRQFGAVPYTDVGTNDQVLIMACKTKSEDETGI